MNNLWKRTASLVLSGILLVSCVPTQAWASEDIQEPDDTEQIMPMDEIEEVLINGEAVPTDSTEMFYSDGILTLSGVTGIETIEVNDVSLTIVLEGDNEINAGEAVAITTDRDLTITGEGSLLITTSNPVAVEVEGTEEGTNVLRIDDVQVWIEVEEAVSAAMDESGAEREQPVGIDCADGVLIQGAAHFRTSHSCAADIYVMTCDGYVNSEAYIQETPVSGGEMLEFISETHLGDWQVSADRSKHYKSCANDECILFAGTKVGEHDAERSVWKKISNTHHQKVYACCEMPEPGRDPKKHKLAYSAEGASIAAICTDCQAGETFTLTAQNIEQGSEIAAVSFTAPTGVLSDKITEDMIVYRDDEGNPLEETPAAIGDYTAEIALEEENVVAVVSFSITKIDFSKAEITLAENSVVYNGEEQKPAVLEVKLNGKVIEITPDQIAYHNNINATTEASKATVTVIPPEDSDYINDAVKEFTIVARDITADDVKLGETLTYNGQDQEQTVVLAENSAATFTVTGNKQTNAGENYKLTVTGTGNYKGTIDLSYSIARTEYYTDATRKEQLSGKNVGDLELPRFTGIGGEAVVGKCTYTVTSNDEEVQVEESAIQEKIKNGMEPGDQTILNYVFTPADNGNYQGVKSGSIEITKVDLTFELEDGKAVTNENVKKTGSIIYGDTDIINTSLIAKANGVPGNQGEGFTVAFAKIVNGVPEETRADAPGIGSNKFWLSYSGTVDGYTFADVLVCEGWITVSSKHWSEEDLTKPVAAVLAEKADGTALALLKDANKGSIDEDSEALEYRLGNTGAWSKEIPTATEAGYYEVYYRPSAKYTPQTEGKVQVLVVPYLTATYGDALEHITLPNGFRFHAAEHPDLTRTVGNAGERKVKLDYTHPNDHAEVADDYPTLTGYEVTLKVNPKMVTPVVTLNTDVYDRNEDEYIPFSEAAENDLFIVTADGKTLVYGTDYTLQKTATTDGLIGKHIISGKDGSNYTFEDVEGSVKLYRAAHSVLTKENFPEDTLEDYETVDQAKEGLSEELKADSYPEDLMKFFKVYVTKQVGDNLADNQWAEHTADDAFPPAGLTYEIPYSALSNASEDDHFEVAVLYLAGDDAGKIVSQEAVNTDTGLKINLKREAVVCVAREIDLTKEYTITKSIVLDSKTSTRGTLTVKVDNKTATKATYGKTVKVTASAKSGYSVVSVIVTDASGNKVETKQDGSNYEFKMPASDVTIKLSLKKTTSSSKNPGSGDSSNIQLWTTILAASGIGVVAALFFWLRKRKK